MQAPFVRRFRGWSTFTLVSAAGAGILATVLPVLFEYASPYLLQAVVEEAAPDPAPHQIFQEQVEQVSPGDPLKVSLLLAQGNVLRSQGLYAEAGTTYVAALANARTYEQRADAKHMIGKSLLCQGRLKSARKELDDALAIMSHRRVGFVDLLHDLGDLRVEMGHIEEGVDHYTQAYESAILASDDDKLALVAADVSEAWARKGLFEETSVWLLRAEDHLEKMRRTAAGVDKLIEAKVLSFIAANQHMAANFSNALGLYRRAVQTQGRLLRPAHPDLVATQLSVARAHRDLGDFDQAMELLQPLEAMLREELQVGPDLGRVLIFKSDVLRQLGRLEEAEQVALEVREVQAQSFQGEDHPDTAVAFSTLGSILHDAGRHAEAQKEYEASLATNLHTVGEVHPETASSYNSLGTLYQDTGDDNKAHDYFVKCLRIQVETMGRVHPQIANTYNNLATSLYRQGDASLSAAFFRKALHVLDTSGVDKDHPVRAMYAENLEEVRSKYGDATADGDATQDQLADDQLEKLVGIRPQLTEFDDLDDDFNDHPARRYHKFSQRVASSYTEPEADEVKDNHNDFAGLSGVAVERVEVDGDDDIFAAMSELLAEGGGKAGSQFAIGADATFLLQKDVQVVKGGKKSAEEDASKETTLSTTPAASGTDIPA